MSPSRPAPLALPVLLLALPLLVLACRELGKGEDGKGPGLRFVLPAPNDTVPRVFQVELVAEDPSGVEQVSLSCPSSTGAIALLAVWSQGPYRQDVDVAGCATTPIEDSPLSTVTLTVRAQDRQGNGSELSQALSVDAQLPALTLTLRHVESGLPLAQGRVPPGATVEAVVQLAAGGPLRQAPTLTVDGETRVMSGPREGPTFTAQLQVPGRTRPQRGLADGGAVDLTAALETEFLLSVAAEATNERGNHTRLEQVLTVSRLLWTTPLPGRPPVPASRPQAIDAGLLLPLNFDTATPAQWVPVFVDVATGEPLPVPLPPPLGKNEILVGRKISEEGRILIQSPDRSLVLGPRGEELNALAPGLPGTSAVGSALARFCEPQVRATCQGADFRCARSAPQVEPGFNTTLPLDGAGANNFHGAVTAAAGSAGNLLFHAYGQQAAPGNTCCGPASPCGTWLTLVTPANQTQLVQVAAVDEIVPDRGGGFFLRNGTSLQHLRPDPTTPLRSYRAPFSVQGRILAAFADTGVLLALPSPGFTDFTVWHPEEDLPRALLRIPGFYSQSQLTTPAGTPRVFEDFVLRQTSATEGTVTVLSSSTGTGASLTHRLLHFRYGPDFLELQWVMDFAQGAANPQLVGDPNDVRAPLFLIDSLWQKIYAVLP